MDWLDHLERGILAHWIKHAPDTARGGFLGKLGPAWEPDPAAPKGLVQHARFMWTFSAAYRHLERPEFKIMADRARSFLEDFFRDRLHGGWLWSVSAGGPALDARKHVYPHSFVIYAFSEYARAFGDPGALDTALETFSLLEKHVLDREHGGYIESFDQGWKEIPQHEDIGIKGNRKSMNSHIHMLEALTALCLASGNAAAPHARLLDLIGICGSKIFNPARHSLDLFFERDWTRLPSPTSFGHDIELSWLMSEATHVAGLQEADTRETTILLARNTLKAVLPGGGRGIAYEGDSAGAAHDKRRIWWAEAEALVGFANAYRLTGEQAFREAFLEIEQWVENHQIDRTHGDWHEAIGPDDRPSGDKGHLWKEPYHQSRACLELAAHGFISNRPSGPHNRAHLPSSSSGAGTHR